mmetsp:Transcript_104747/g.182083  ORF Transcript_104747/g.182083 Transcript_104747/m.182083 type:complete len:276 (-) Transcript_104747:96-923(-)
MSGETVATAVHPSKGRPKAPHVNLFDMPELMPGAQPSANPAQREEFEQRCRKLHDDAVAEEQTRAEVKREAAGSRATTSDLEAMFPALDAALVRTLAAEAPTPQHAIETLLALAAATAEPVAGGERAASPPPRDLGVEDMDKFPSLCDGDGWQVVSKQQLERDPDEELGNAWRDRAKAAASKPAPKVKPAAPDAGYGTTRRKASRQKDDEHAREQPQLETDYEFRQRIGQKRASNRAQYGRGRGRGGRGAGTQAGRGAGNADDEESVTEEEVDEV